MNKDIKPNIENYDNFYKNFRWEIPEYYNFAYDVVDKHAKENGDKTALISVDHNGENPIKHTFSDLSGLSNKFANVLKKYGVKKGDRVFIMLPRIPEWYITVLGCMKAEAIFMPTPTLSMPKDIEYRINQAEASIAITNSEFASR
ncbi:MAG: acyl-CoA synthetase, partial [Thermoplasmata archaeon]